MKHFLKLLCGGYGWFYIAYQHNLTAMPCLQVRFLQIVPFSYNLCKDCDCRILDHRYDLHSVYSLYFLNSKLAGSDFG
jgi:hypothetical protein